MTNQATVDQIGYLFTFPFTDQDWMRKLFIAFLLTIGGFIIPIIPGLFVAGYAAKIMKMGIDDEAFHLPEWDDWNDLLINGLRLTGVGLIAFLPFILLFACGYLTIFAPMIGSGFLDPSYGQKIDPAWLLSLMGAQFGGMCMMGVSIVLVMFAGLLIPPAIGHVVAKSQFSAAFRLREWWPIFKANLGGYVISYILLMGTFFLFGYAGQLLYFTVVLCCLMPFLMGLLGAYISLLVGAVFGQAYRVGKDNLRLVASIEDAPTIEPEDSEVPIDQSPAESEDSQAGEDD